ncbi:MAG: two-component system response regulator [Flavobacteriales bacterium]|nr:two-component system response regulator [Flavobacteriales bacterium]|tara:strand:- start:16629 stop:18179 length:1551 start_codon:yes stop_codon:yes gene_type:complete
MNSGNILWIDDEVDSLKSHIVFLQEKGFNVNTVNNGYDAIDLVKDNSYDLIFLDENMPGLTGLDTLSKLKEIINTPVIMITKNEQEQIMEEAIGSKISDYLIKPVNPHQILLTIKKNLNFSKLINNKTNSDYQKEFLSIGSMINNVYSFSEWIEIYRKIVYWELELDSLEENNMLEILLNQKKEANLNFFKYIKKNYSQLVNSGADSELTFSHNLFKKHVLPKMSNGNSTFFLVIDNLRFDQWKVIKPLLQSYFSIDEDMYCSILPTATQYCRNAIFSGLMPSEMKKKFPQFWLDDIDEGGKNLYEKDFLIHNLKNMNLHPSFSFNKVFNLEHGKKMIERVNEFLHKSLNVIIYNFVDILSHSKTDIKMIKELANDEKSYRDLTLTWFKNSPLFELLKQLSTLNVNIIITSDHGTINVTEPSKLIGEKNISSNLRYKTGRKIKFDNRDVFYVDNPDNILLPKTNMSSSYVFAAPNKYFVYPNNYNHYAHHYINTYQHGGISMEEMIIPIISLSSKK